MISTETHSFPLLNQRRRFLLVGILLLPHESPTNILVHQLHRFPFPGNCHFSLLLSSTKDSPVILIDLIHYSSSTNNKEQQLDLPFPRREILLLPSSEELFEKKEIENPYLPKSYSELATRSSE